MNSKRSAVAALAIAIGATTLASTEAWARDPDKEIPVEPAVVLRDPSPPNYAAYDPSYRVIPAETAGTADHSRVEVVQAGGSALGGAAVACGVMWLYRRRGRLAS
jgi:hypothetical protein